MQYTEILQKAGLTEPQAVIFEALIKEKDAKAGKLAKLLPLKRGLIYKSLEDLVALGLVEKEEKPGEIARFRPKHPAMLREVAEKRTQAMKEAEAALAGVLPALVSQYNLGSGTPGVLVYEGEEGIEKVLDDSLQSKTEILTYADIEAIAKYIPKENEAYVKNREKFDITKRGIVLDTSFAREYLKGYHAFVTDTHFLKASTHSFESVMMMYDGKISYLTLSEEKKIGVIIADPQLYVLHKTLFEFLWKATEEVVPEILNPNFS